MATAKRPRVLNPMLSLHQNGTNCIANPWNGRQNDLAAQPKPIQHRWANVFDNGLSIVAGDTLLKEFAALEKWDQPRFGVMCKRVNVTMLYST